MLAASSVGLTLQPHRSIVVGVTVEAAGVLHLAIAVGGPAGAAGAAVGFTSSMRNSLAVSSMGWLRVKAELGGLEVVLVAAPPPVAGAVGVVEARVALRWLTLRLAKFPITGRTTQQSRVPPDLETSLGEPRPGTFTP